MIYLIHFDTPYKHARHYIGFVEDIDHLIPRLCQHKQGQGARLMEVVSQSGITWQLARVFVGDRTEERRLKKSHNAPRLCPICNPRLAQPGYTVPDWSDVEEIAY